MKIFSQEIVHFLKNAKKLTLLILKNEMGLEVGRDSFHFKKIIYPISLSCFTDEREKKTHQLAFFSPNFHEISFNYTKVKSFSNDQLSCLIRHELAHYLCHLIYGSQITHHGAEFRQLCMSYHWEEDVYKATQELPSHDHENEALEDAKVTQKIHKLLKLSKSDNLHEAEVALAKAKTLMLEHQISELDLNPQDSDELYYVDVVFQAKRNSTYMSCMVNIMNHFFVKAMIHYGQHIVQIELLGTKDNVIAAKHIFEDISYYLENVWHNQYADKYKGLKAKNSFYLGFSQGVIARIQEEEKYYEGILKNQMIKVANQLITASSLAYPRLRSHHSKVNINQQAMNDGFQSGKRWEKINQFLLPSF